MPVEVRKWWIRRTSEENMKREEKANGSKATPQGPPPWSPSKAGK